jgi:hypothetical protein
MAVSGGVAAVVAWDLLVAIIAKRRPVPLILYAIGMIGAATVAAILIVASAPLISTIVAESIAVGFIGALGVTIIWQSTHRQEKGGTQVAVHVMRAFLVRGLTFSALIVAASLIVRIVRGG